MSIFDKGLDPLKEIQKASKTAGEAATRIAEGASGMAVAARAAIVDATTAAGEAASRFADEASEAATTAGAAIVDAATTAGTAVAGAASSAKAVLDEKAAERLDAEKAEYAPKVQEALKAIEGTRAQELLDSFQESPLPLTEANAAKVKSTFPIPREQTVVWADAEFDLRPSGIAMTEKGVYIKADADAFAVPGKEKRQSRLFYFEWAHFEPGSFASDGESNLALTVDEACRGQFVSRCQALGSLEESRAAFAVDGALAGADDAVPKAAAVAAAAAINSNGEVFVEQRAAVNNPAGHGELAEEANNIIDRLQGHQAEILGRDNAKNGADRRVDGILVQTKYYKTACGSLEACFDPSNHQYRYVANDGTPMQLEVPKDQYQQVLRGFEEKIRQGKVPGVSDPKDAEKIVRKGKLTYDQAVNLTKPGTVESVAYDAATGAVTCSCAFGLSFLATSFMAYRETKDVNGAIQAGIAAGVQVFGLSFVQHMVVSQLSRTGLSNALMAPSQAVVGKLGFKASATIVNGLRALTGKTAISGAAASKQLAKMLRGNAVSAAVTLAVFSVPETYKLFQGKASGAQYAQNIASLATSVAGGIAGAAAAGVAAAKVGAAAGTAVSPGVGTVVGLAGGMVGGTIGTAAAGAVGGILFEGDCASFVRYFNAMVSCMAVEYLLDGHEMDELLTALDSVKSSEFKELMEETLSSQSQEAKVRAFLAPKFDEVASRREHFALPTDEQINNALARLEEEAEEKPATQCVSIDGIGEICIPAFFQPLCPLPEDSDSLKSFGAQSKSAQMLLYVGPSSEEEAMPFSNPQSVIDGIHECLGDNQRLITVECTKTGSGEDATYSIVKTVEPFDGAQYCLTMDIESRNGVFRIQGFFAEAGTTGMRDAVVMATEGKGGTLEEDQEAWSKDPYDVDFKRGIPMNRSEDPEYDDAFPWHPLSICRQTARDIIAGN